MKTYTPQPAPGQALLSFIGRRAPETVEIFESSVVESVRAASPAQLTLSGTVPHLSSDDAVPDSPDLGTEAAAAADVAAAGAVDAEAADAGAVDVSASPAAGQPEGGNLLLHGDCLSACALLKERGVRVDLVYIDPPFASGANYAKKIYLRTGAKTAVETADSSLGEEVMYADIWAKEDYLNWLYERLLAIRDVMSETASIYVHLDWHIGHYAKILLDEVFGENNFKNEIIWYYPGREMHVENKFNAKHDTIFFYSKSEDARVRMDAVANPYDREERLKSLRRKVHKDEDGTEWVWETRGQAAGQEPYKRYVDEIISSGQALNDVWDDIPSLRGNDPERVGYSTQKPPALLERIIKASSDAGMVVADFFMGSGTTAEVAQRLGRGFIGCDVGQNAIQTARDRLVKAGASFDVVKIHDGVRLLRNPAQTQAKLFSLLDGYRSASDAGLGGYWDGALARPNGTLSPLKWIGLTERLTPARVDVLLNEMAELEDSGGATGEVTLLYAFKDPQVTQRRINDAVKESQRTTLSIKLLSLNDLLGRKLDALYAEDSADIQIAPDGDSQRVTIVRYYSSYLEKKVAEFNAQKVRKKLIPVTDSGENGDGESGDENSAEETAQPSGHIVISPAGLELIESVQFDRTLRADGVWTSDLSLEDKAGPKEKIKATYRLPSGPFCVKIRNIAGDEIVWDSRTSTSAS